MLGQDQYLELEQLQFFYIYPYLICVENEKDFFMRLAIRRWYSFLGFQRNNIKNIKSIISPSESSKSDIKKYFNCPEEKINVIWNGIDLSDHKLSTKVGFNANLVTIISSDVPMKNLKIGRAHV